MRFKEIIGQETIKQQLIQTVAENRVSHAQLFLSCPGSGAFPLAIAYAQYLNCLQKTAIDSCGECSSCRKYERYIHPDLHFSYPFFASKDAKIATDVLDQWRKMLLHDAYFDMDIWRSKLQAENKQANINIAECHDIIKKLSYKAFEGETKVLIMWLPEYLEKEGNALLKIIEEPPQNTLFILVANNQDQILSTLLSRTQIVKIPKLPDATIESYLMENHGLSEQQAIEYSFLADGNLIEAKMLVENAQNDHAEKFAEWLMLGYGNKVLELSAFVDQAASWGRENQKNFLKLLKDYENATLVNDVHIFEECCVLQNIFNQTKSITISYNSNHELVCIALREFGKIKHFFTITKYSFLIFTHRKCYNFCHNRVFKYFHHFHLVFKRWN